MDNLQKIMTVFYCFTAVNGFITLLVGHLSPIEKLPNRKIVIIVGWTVFLGSFILVVEDLFLK